MANMENEAQTSISILKSHIVADLPDCRFLIKGKTYTRSNQNKMIITVQTIPKKINNPIGMFSVIIMLSMPSCFW